MTEKIRDLVCGMEVDKDLANASSDYKGKHYFFCSLECKDKFTKEPERYISHQKK